MWINPRDHKIVGSHLAALRLNARVTQSELAKRLRKPQSFVSAVENGQRRIDLLEFASVVLALGGSPSSICTKIFDDLEHPNALKRRRIRKSN